MSRECWRIVKDKHVSTAFDGEGARRYPGRWNSAGSPAVYTASSTSLALLEMLVHLERDSILTSYSIIPVRMPKSCVKIVAAADLPADWRDDPPPLSTRSLGDAWLKSRVSACLEVPSAIVPGETIVLVNPSHPDFNRIEIGEAQQFPVDPRLAD